MKYVIPIRKVNVYQSEDGRKIEEHKTKFSLIEEIDLDKNEIDINVKDVIYIGVATIPTNMGSQEIKFPVEADSLKEAFEKFELSLQKVFEESESQIVRASQSDLDILTRSNEEDNSSGIIL